jgi:hypothetical protein
MSLPMPPNVSVDVYRTADPSSPYPGGGPAVSGVKGYLKPAVTDGRFGTAQYLKWTHILFVPPGTDVRDAYNSQLDPSRTNGNADTIILDDSTISGRMTAYYVVYVEVVARSTAQQYLRVYLDRFAPNAWPTDSL